MEFNNLGELLKSLRLEKGWSQEEACKDICDRRTYLRWEKNICEPSIYYFNLLSNRFNYDLNAYYKIFICDKSLTAWRHKEAANQYVNSNNWAELYVFINNIKNLPDFSLGENKMTVQYYHALYHNKFTNNYELSSKYCIEGLKEEDINITLAKPIGKIYSNIGLCLLNCLSSNYKKTKKYNLATEIYLTIINNIESKLIPNITYYQSFNFEKKLYQTIINNLCLYYMQSDNILLALNYVNKGISFSNQYHYLDKLPDLLEIKFKLLYLQNEYKLAKEIYRLCVGLYQLQNRIDEYLYCEKLLYNQYPELLYHSD